MDVIKIRGARQHNLKNLDVDLPKSQLVVITGPSGCGKSSLAFHTLYAEGQRRYVESLSAYARQFLEQLEKPQVDSIEGLSPAISIEQKTSASNPRSTVATSTEIYDYLRILYAAAGVPHDPATGERLQRMSSADIINSLAGKPERSKVILLAPIPLSEAEDLTAMVMNLQRQGFVRIRVNGQLQELDEAVEQWPEQLDQLEIVADRVVIRDGIESRLADSVELAMRLCGTEVRALVMQPDDDDWSELAFQTSYRNPTTGFEIGEISPKHFSFNSHLAACPCCHGLGIEQFCDPALVIPDTSVSLADGAVKIWPNSAKKPSWNGRQIEALAMFNGVAMDVPVSQLPKSFMSQLFYGTGEEKVPMHWEKDGVQVPMLKPYEGLCVAAERHYRESKSDSVKKSVARFMTKRSCSACGGRRLKPEILAVKLMCDADEGLSIDELCALPVEQARQWLDDFQLQGAANEALAGVLGEARQRISFLDAVGLSYLSLDRASHTLSGGESQRIRLASQLGAGLSGVIYVLDEPSIGLHAADNERLIQAMLRLRDLGNSVVVVEHDEATIKAADWVIDMGPAAGRFGGEILAQGKPAEIAKMDSPTGKWFAHGGRQLEPPRRQPDGRQLVIKNAREHNLQGIDVAIPLGLMVCVAGPSGSGKSTLIDGILRRALARQLHRATAQPGAHDAIEGAEQIDKLVVVNQKPLGKSPRSNAATYTGALDLVRSLFAQLPLSKQRGYLAGRFSFNNKGGRCEKCAGDGAIRIDMHFLSDVFVTCDACQGKRYNRETLEVTFKGRNMADVLDMSCQFAQEFFQNVPKLNAILQALCDVGLGYLKLGQAANTLSGGEAQRIKLALELAKPPNGHTLYLLDEPTRGLHYQDVEVLLAVLNRIVDAGHSMLIIEHQCDVLKAADWIIDMGPGGGVHGGNVVAQGAPNVIVNEPQSITGPWLKDL
ncbi:excinuclease ABC subunit UvrA [Persicirhabdus sediminis]|uniref:UvrABC system protein A n=1 Tax=Persicirhabdus sediminis TaxID=454144 RepID=A0A8J7SJ07_9BACT|nr:excinuclease ABC subunit UvrA [Persicirhabdus sediminis]